MAYENDAYGFDQYKIIGVMTVPKLSVKDNLITYYGSLSDTIIGYNDTHTTPQIILNESAFNITLTDATNKPSGSFVGIITSVRDYQIDEEKDWIHITFKYRNASDRVRQAKVTVVDPVISRLYTEGKYYLGMFLEGSEEAIAHYINDRLDVFYHEPYNYFEFCSFRVGKNVVLPDNTPDTVGHIGTVLIASTVKIPNQLEITRFTNKFLAILGFPGNAEKYIDNIFKQYMDAANNKED